MTVVDLGALRVKKKMMAALCHPNIATVNARRRTCGALQPADGETVARLRSRTARRVLAAGF